MLIMRAIEVECVRGIPASDCTGRGSAFAPGRETYESSRNSPVGTSCRFSDMMKELCKEVGGYYRELFRVFEVCSS